jgi:hypothetical protein
MFDPQIALAIRSVSLFHVWMPVLLVWLLYRLGYDRSALLWQTVVALIIIPLSYLFSDPKTNVNWVYGFGDKPQSTVSAQIYVLLLMVAFPLLLYLPTHLVLLKFFRQSHAIGH